MRGADAAPRDALTERLKTCWQELRTKDGRNPKPARVAEAAGGLFDSESGSWEFTEGELSQAALHERLSRIRKEHFDMVIGGDNAQLSPGCNFVRTFNPTFADRGIFGPASSDPRNESTLPANTAAGA